MVPMTRQPARPQFSGHSREKIGIWTLNRELLCVSNNVLDIKLKSRATANECSERTFAYMDDMEVLAICQFCFSILSSFGGYYKSEKGYEFDKFILYQVFDRY